MADKVYPSAKPPAAAAANVNPTATANRPFPSAKSQLYRPPGYRPAPHRRRSHRSLCCACCLWITLVIFTILLLAAISGAAIYVVYRPQRPSFSISSLQISQFNLTSTTLTSNVNFNLTAKNPNKKLIFFYDPITVSLSTNDGVSIGDGALPAFQLGTKNTTVLTSTVAAVGESLDTTSGGQLQADAKSKSGLGLTVEFDTKISVKFGGVKTKKVKVRVTCEGIKAGLPTEEVVASPAPAPSPVATITRTVTVASPATVSGGKCKVDLRVKIWKWTW